MFHFKIISAHDLFQNKCNSCVHVIPKINDTENYFDYYITDKVKDTDPEYNEEILIPFYCFDSLQLVIFQKKLLAENSIARVNIPLNIQTFINNQPQSTAIEFYSSSSNFKPTFNFSISYFPLQSLPTKPASNPSLIFIYLTYNPPLQHNTQEVHLTCKGVTDNGTIYDPSTNDHITVDEESVRCGPSGLTQIIKINHYYVKNGKFFFYIKSMGYTGKVTLNFATAPTQVSETNHSEYFFFNDPSCLDVASSNGSENMYALFPVKLVLSPNSVTVGNLSINSNESIQKVPSQNSEADQNAQKKLIQLGGTQIVGSGKAINIRLDVEPGTRYSLNELYRKNSIDIRPDLVMTSLSFSSSTYLSFHVWMCGDAGEGMNPFIFYNEHDITAKIYIDYYSQNEVSAKRIFFNLKKMEATVKYIALFGVSNATQKGQATKKIWSDASCCLSDPYSKKELISFTMPSKNSPCAFLIAMFVKVGDDNWEFWPCSYYIGPKNVITYSNSISPSDLRTFLLDFMLKGQMKQIFHL
ncbi:hypothetical protein M9Y10_018413 [Tritrichomonas musculus]|uniref:C2 domain-containing protein n=1 Tax=Tritrichomonas musculus TaxID=1915356 RepID=A0ABR2HPD7_9EUKA